MDSHVCSSDIHPGVPQAIVSFIQVADFTFGPITKIRKDGETKSIPWAAFAFTAENWEQVRLCAEILEVRPCTAAH